MTVALDAVYPSSAGFWSGGQVTSGSWQHTCTGTSLVLIVDVAIGASPDNGLGVNASFGGQSMTLLAGPLHPGGDNSGFEARFILLNAPAGRNTVSVNVTGGKGTIAGASVSFNGANQSTGVGTTYSATGTGTNPTVAVSSNTTGNIILSSAVAGRTFSGPGSGGTKLFTRNGTTAYDAGGIQGASWAATGSSVTTQFTLKSSDDWSIISHEILSSTGAILLTTPNLQLTSGTFGTAFSTAQWWNTMTRAPNDYYAGAPPLLPIQIGVVNTDGNWLFALVSWRQDAGVPGVLQFPSTISVSDDAGNYWIPLQAGLHNTGIVRCAIWMAPAARAATVVTISPASTMAGDAFQSALFAMVFQVAGACPWYSVEETDFAFTNQGTSLTVSQKTPTTGLFSVGMVASDNPYGMPVSVSSGLTFQNLVTFPFGNGVDNTGDLQQWGFVAPSTPGSDLSLTISRSSGNAVADLAGVIITVHGVTDAIPFPYPVPLRNWPVIVTEIGAGPVINANPVMISGTADWTLQPADFLSGGNALNGGLGTWVALVYAGGVVVSFAASISSPGSSGSMQMTAQGTGGMQAVQVGGSGAPIIANGMPTTAGSSVSAGGWFLTASVSESVTVGIAFFDVTGTFISSSFGAFVTDVTGSWTYAFNTATAPAGTRYAIMTALVNGSSNGEVHYFGTAFLYDGAVTGPGGTLASVTWPNYQSYPNYQALVGTPADLSLALTPSGLNATMQLLSEADPVSVSLRYAVNAWVFCPGNNGEFLTLQPQIIWYDNTGTNIVATDSGPQLSPGPGEWENLLFPQGIYPPGGAVFAAAAILVTTTQTFIPASNVVYVGYCGIGAADSYENNSPDDIAWSDVSSRNFTQGAIQISRGIQYEQQSLEAGTMTMFLVNSDGAMMFGNLLSTYWPNIGDTDVPVRLRAIWYQSITPYTVLFSGFTDQITFGWDESTWFGYVQIQASDAWSRMTTQMLEPYVEEVLEDDPVVLTTLSDSGANIALSNITPMAQIVSNFGAGSAVATFAGNSISLPGASSLSNWEVNQAPAGTATPAASAANQGIALGYFPPGNTPLPPVSGGVTAEFWLASQNTGAAGTLSANLSPPSDLVVCTAWSGGGPTWSLFIDNSTGNSINTQLQVGVYDQVTGVQTVTNLGSYATFLFGTASTVNSYIAVSFTQSQLTVSWFTPGGGFFNSKTVPCNLAPSLIGFSLGGNAGPLYATAGTVSTLGFWSPGFADFAVYDEVLPPARLTAHYSTSQAIAVSGYSENQGEPDIWRLARVLGYAGATPVVLQEQGWGVPLSFSSFVSIPAADADMVTALTDTNGQVTSSYFTNIASSTLAFMFVNGPGTLIYRRRLQQYNRQPGQWVLGDNPANNLCLQPMNTPALSDWFAFSPTTFTSSSVPSQALFSPYCGLMQANGSTASPAVFYGILGGFQGVPNIIPGAFYLMTASVYSPQGWATGGQIGIVWLNSSFVGISSYFSPITPIPAASPTFMAAGAWTSFRFPELGRAPAGAAFAFLSFTADGTPPANVQFFITNVQFTFVPPVAAPGLQPPTVYFDNALAESEFPAPEVPYLIGTHLSSDRALLFNQVILNQFGTSTNTTFTGSNIVFQPTSGVVVTIQDTPSVVARAGVPYTATLYLNNTAQQSPYYLYDPSMEDFGNWIVNTLSAPLLRPEAVTITPSSTPQAMIMALTAEIADTVTYRRRPLGGPEIQVLTYISKLTHTIDISSGEWNVQYELSPYQAGEVIATDDSIHGTLTGGNLLGW